MLVFSVSFFFLWNTEIVNRAEADIAYETAWQVEHDGHDWLYHPHHLLYGAVTKDLYNGARLLGYGGRAYPLLRLISALCGAGAVLMFFRFCYRRFSMRPVSSLLCSFLLLFSYGFWRYANEVGVIVPACLAMLCALYFSIAPKQTAGQAAVAGVLCGISVLFHILNVIPVFLAVPLFYLLQRNWRGLFLNFTAALTVTVAGYTGVYIFESAQIFGDAPALLPLTPGSFIKGLIGFSQCVASGNFMLGVAWVRDTLTTLFPARMLLEELYMGRALSAELVAAATCTYVLLAGCFAAVCILACRIVFFHAGSGRRRDRVGTVEGWHALLIVMIWFAGYAGALLLLEPGNPEVWVMGLVPFWLGFCGLAVAPLARKNILWPVLLLAGLLALHNYTGGMLPLKNPEGDYNRQKAAWVLEHAGSNDIILTAGNPVFERYLRYVSPAKTDYLHSWQDRRLDHPEAAMRLLRSEIHPGGAVYILGDVFSQPVSLTKRFPEKTASIRRFAETIRPLAEPIHTNEFAGVYLLKKGF
jgi:hypothetical protein